MSKNVQKDELLEYVIQDINSIYSDYSLQKAPKGAFLVKDEHTM